MADENFLIVSIGSSAGGVEPCVRLVREVPADAGLAIVIVNHLRRGPTMLAEILARATSMRTQLITSGMSVERNHFTWSRRIAI
jgi:two-component system chemotaxis response regulator CheB